MKHFKSSGIYINWIIGQKFVWRVQHHLKSSKEKYCNKKYKQLYEKYEIVAEENIVVKNTKNYMKHSKVAEYVWLELLVNIVQHHMKSSGGKYCIKKIPKMYM